MKYSFHGNELYLTFGSCQKRLIKKNKANFQRERERERERERCLTLYIWTHNFRVGIVTEVLAKVFRVWDWLNLQRTCILLSVEQTVNRVWFYVD